MTQEEILRSQTRVLATAGFFGVIWLYLFPLAREGNDAVEESLF
jgi:hypothetical protein